MTLQQLVYAVTIADFQSVNKAAGALFLSQSSLSAALKHLEEEIGISLFSRSNRGVRTTPEGEEFLAHARQIVGEYRLAEEKFILKKESKKRFSVSAQHYSFAVKAFIEVVKRFAIDEYAFGFYECQTAEILENVRRYKSELGVIYMDEDNRAMLQKRLRDSDLTFTGLFSCKVFVFMAKTHPLAKKKKLKLEQLAPYPCLSFDQGENEAFYLAEEVYSTWNYSRMIRASDRATMLNFMVGLNGYTLCSGIISEELNGDGYCVVPLTSDKVMQIGYVRRAASALSPLGSLYVEELKKCDVHLLH